MPSWSDRVTWRRTRQQWDEIDRRPFLLAKHIVAPIEASSEEPQAEDATVTADYSRTASTPPGAAGRASSSPEHHPETP